MRTLNPKLNEKILNIALDSFYKEGYEKTSMRVISYKCRTSVGNLYRYFKNKEEVFTTLTSPVATKLREIMDEAIKTGSTNLLNEDLQLVLKHFYELVEEYPKHLVIYLEYYGEQASGDALLAFKEYMLSTIKNFLSNMDDNLVKLTYNYLVYGVIYLIRNEKKENLVNSLNALFIYIFKDIKGRIT